MTISCPACGTVNDAGLKTCVRCGKSLPQVAQKPGGSVPPLVGDDPAARSKNRPAPAQRQGLDFAAPKVGPSPVNPQEAGKAPRRPASTEAAQVAKQPVPGQPMGPQQGAQPEAPPEPGGGIERETPPVPAPAGGAPPTYPGRPPQWPGQYPAQVAPYPPTPGAYEQPGVPGYRAPYPVPPAFPSPYMQYGYPPPWFPPYPMGPYGQQSYPPPPFAPPPYPGAYPAQPYPYPPAKKKMGTGTLVIIVIVSLLLIGGGIAAAVLLTGKKGGRFRLGDGTVSGAKIEFKDMTIEQSGNNLTLSGTYDNKSKLEGDVYITVQAVSNGSEQVLSFTVPVEKGSGKSFSKRQATSIELSGATLGSLVFEGGGSTYPWDSGDENGSTAPKDQDTYPQENTYPNDGENPTFPIPESTP